VCACVRVSQRIRKADEVDQSIVWLANFKEENQVYLIKRILLSLFPNTSSIHIHHAYIKIHARA